MELPPFPDAETVVLELLAAVAPTVTATADPLILPVIRVQRVGGADDGISDNPRIEVACYGATRAQAWQMAERCRQLVLAGAMTTVAGALIDKAATETPAVQLPDDSPDVRRVVGTYRLVMRRPRQP
ncbi:MAG: phage tail termination protein [Pseudonocardiales bacterium]